MTYIELDFIRGIHKGRRAWVFGSGWSLDTLDWSLVKDGDVTLFCNASVVAAPKTVRVDYFAMTDGAVPESSFFDYGVSRAGRVLFLSMGFPTLPALCDMWRSDHLGIRAKALFFTRRYGDHNMDYDAGHELIVGSDVVQPAAHWAWAAGCSPIVLAGVDLRYRAGTDRQFDKYCKSIGGAPEVKWKPNEGRKPTPVAPDGWAFGTNLDGLDDGGLQGSWKEWGDIVHANPDVTFYNASPAGRLTEWMGLLPELVPGFQKPGATDATCAPSQSV